MALRAAVSDDADDGTAADDGAVSSGPVDSARAADTEPPAAATASMSADAASMRFDSVSILSTLSILTAVSAAGARTG
jgi:hypothetical protein